MSDGLTQAVRAATAVLAEHGIDSAESDAITLAAHLLGLGTGELRKAMILGGPLPSGFEGYEELVAERARRVPLQHLTGTAAFRRLELAVGPGVFIPRPETELTAELAITALRHPSLRREGAPGGAVVVDLCTGSGAIALSVKDEVPLARVHAVELSELAHAWALRNRKALGLDVDLRLGDATTAFPELEGAVDVVVSNPPYIPLGMVPNDPEVRDHDPRVALYGGSADGLAIPLAVAARAAVLLRPDGLLVMEHADVQGDSLPRALASAGVWRDVTDHLDLTGRPRAVTGRRSAD